MAGVFVSYRRDDSQGFAGRLADDLTEIWGADLVFRDVEIPVGQDFTEVLQRAVAACDVLIVVIGRNWQLVSTPGGQPRLFAPADWVRAEIEAAFTQDKQVIPVLVAGAKMCTAAELPESIAELSRIQAYVMSDRRWDDDIQGLVQLLQMAAPVLKTGSSQQDPAESPAQVLRELGHRVLDEVTRKSDGKNQPEYISPRRRSRLMAGVGWSLKKLLTALVLIAVIYIGIRLFGDTESLQKLDQFEARMQTGWNRFSTYLNSM